MIVLLWQEALSCLRCPIGEGLPTSQHRISRAMDGISMDLDALKGAYSAGLKPTDIAKRLYPLLAAETGIFITLLSLEDLLARCRSCAIAPSSNTCCSGALMAVQLHPAYLCFGVIERRSQYLL